jgi:hypothetical protein
LIVILRVRSTVREYPRQFWVLFASELINAAGAGLVFPFISRYLSHHLNFSMTDVGMFFGLYAIISTFSQLAGGSLAKGTSPLRPKAPCGVRPGRAGQGRLAGGPDRAQTGHALQHVWKCPGCAGFSGLGGAAPACLTDISAADMVI